MSFVINAILRAFVLGAGPLTALSAGEGMLKTAQDSVCEELKRYAVAHITNGRLNEVERLLSEAMADGRRKCAGSVLADLAAIASVAGRPVEAQQFAERSIKILEIDHVSTDPIMLLPLQILSAVSFEQGKIAKSRQAFERMLQIRAERPEDRAAVHRTAAMLLRNEGRLNEAQEEIIAAIRAWEETGRNGTADYASLLLKLGALYIEQQKYAEARTLLDQALLITASAKDAVRLDLIHALHTRAVLHAREGEWQQAEERFVQALNMIEQETHADPVLLRWLLADYAMLLRKTHRGGEARAFEKRAAALPAFPTRNAVVDVDELRHEAKSTKH